jgi:hypothetical protein
MAGCFAAGGAEAVAVGHADGAALQALRWWWIRVSGARGRSPPGDCAVTSTAGDLWGAVWQWAAAPVTATLRRRCGICTTVISLRRSLFIDYRR